MAKPREKATIWDCGSSLYDSFERNSFERQLDSAIGRTNSMPHLSRNSANFPPPVRSAQSVSPKRSSSSGSKISRSMNKLFRSVFRLRRDSSRVYRAKEELKDGGYYVYDTSSELTTIPETSEHGLDYFSHYGSERFTSSSTLGISCA